MTDYDDRWHWLAASDHEAPPLTRVCENCGVRFASDGRSGRCQECEYGELIRLRAEAKRKLRRNP